MSEDNIKKILDFDPLAQAEKMTRKSYKTSNSTEMLGFAMHIEHSKNKENALNKLGDSTFRTKTHDYINIISSIGFENVYEEEFSRPDHDDTVDTFYVFYNKEHNVILKFDTFWSKESVNGANIFYEHRPVQKKYCSFYSSGQFIKDDIWKGYHDAREAIKYKFNTLLSNGEFINPHTFFDTGIIIYLHDHKSGLKWDDKNSIGWKRFNALPENVKAGFGYIKE